MEPSASYPGRHIRNQDWALLSDSQLLWLSALVVPVRVPAPSDFCRTFSGSYNNSPDILNKGRAARLGSQGVYAIACMVSLSAQRLHVWCTRSWYQGHWPHFQDVGPWIALSLSLPKGIHSMFIPCTFAKYIIYRICI